MDTKNQNDMVDTLIAISVITKLLAKKIRKEKENHEQDESY